MRACLDGRGVERVRVPARREVSEIEHGGREQEPGERRTRPDRVVSTAAQERARPAAGAPERLGGGDRRHGAARRARKTQERSRTNRRIVATRFATTSTASSSAREGCAIDSVQQRERGGGQRKREREHRETLELVAEPVRGPVGSRR